MDDNIKISKSPNLKLAFSITLALIIGFILGGQFPLGNYLNLQKASSLDSEFAEKSLNESGRVGLSDGSLYGNGQTSSKPYLYTCGPDYIIFDLPTDEPPQSFMWEGTNCNLVVSKISSLGNLENMLNEGGTKYQRSSSSSNSQQPLVDRKYSCKSDDTAAVILDFPDPPFNYSSFSFSWPGQGTVFNCNMVPGQ